jgi:hypothetical protein
MMFKEGDQVRLLVPVAGIGKVLAAAGTVGTVVDDVHAPDEYGVDVEVNGQYDNLVVSGDQLTAVTEGAS